MYLSSKLWFLAAVKETETSEELSNGVCNFVSAQGAQKLSAKVEM